MASLVQHTPAAPKAIPLTQNTAPVIEFRCLFTSDIRRKQKRWQDGRLKFHTFNKRVMVYDERLNFVGDTHWHDYHIDEGEELELDRAAILVQVADCLGSRDQDLTELLDKRMKQREERAAVRRPSSSPSEVPLDNLRIPRQSAPQFKLSQKPLSALLGTPTGHHGRALLPTTSPFEDRQREQQRQRDTQERPAKRRKAETTYSKAGYAQNLTGATLDLSSTPHSTAPLRREPLWSRTSRKQEGNGTSREESHQVDLFSREVQEQSKPEWRQRQPPEKKAKSGFAQNLTGAILDLSSTQNTNAFLRHHLPFTPNTEKGLTSDNRLDKEGHRQSRNEAIQPNVLQAPVVEKQSKSQTKAKKGTEVLNKPPTRNLPDSIVKGMHTTSGVQQQDGIGASDEFPSIDDDFIDIDDLEQASRPRNSSIISNSIYIREGDSDLHAIVISPPPQVPPLEESRRPVPIVLDKDSGPNRDTADSPPETVGSIRLKSRPKRKMLLLNDIRRAQPPSIQAARRPTSPAEDIIPEQSQATKKLNEFHTQQRKQLKARAAKRRAAIEEDDDSTSGADTASDSMRGLASKYVNTLLSKPDIPAPEVFKATLPRQPQSERRVQQGYPTTVEDLLPPPTNAVTSQLSRESPEPAPQSSEPAFELLRNVSDRLGAGNVVALQPTSIELHVPIIPEKASEVKASQTKALGTKTPRTRTSGRTQSEISPNAATATAATTSLSNLPVEAPRRKPQVAKPQLLKTSKTARSKIVVGWVSPPEEPVMIQTPQPKVPQRREASDVIQAGAQLGVAAQAVETPPVVSAKAQSQQGVSLLRRRPIARKSVMEKVAESGGLAARSDSGPWSREAFDLFDWRPDGSG